MMAGMAALELQHLVPLPLPKGGSGVPSLGAAALLEGGCLQAKLSRLLEIAVVQLL